MPLLHRRETLLLTTMHAEQTRDGSSGQGRGAPPSNLPPGATAEQAALAAKVERMLSGAHDRQHVGIAHKLRYEVCGAGQGRAGQGIVPRQPAPRQRRRGAPKARACRHQDGPQLEPLKLAER